MSVALVITDTEGHDSLKPVATESVFNSEWLPIAEKHQLQFITLFSTGLPVQQEDIPYILDELSIFIDTIRSNPAQSSILERAVMLSDELKRLQSEGFGELYIG